MFKKYQGHRIPRSEKNTLKSNKWKFRKTLSSKLLVLPYVE